MSYGYEEALARRAATATLSTAGGSGYFAQRAAGLDPALFEHLDHLRPEVRRLVMHRLYTFWHQMGYRYPEQWSELWLAGSGITTAWNADREAGGAPGDLDCLIGIDYQRFTELHAAYRGSTQHDIAHFLNQQMFDHLWPTTARARIGNSVYELTYYINDGVGRGLDAIKAINPYAAYDVNHDQWVVHPVEVPADFQPSYFSVAAREQVAQDYTAARAALEDFQAAQHAVTVANDPARRLNSMRALHNAVAAGAAIYDRIHEGRKAAFAPEGKGYFDPANFRWQAGKANGTISLVRGFKQLMEQAHQDIAVPCSDIGHLTLLAALANGRG